MNNIKNFIFKLNRLALICVSILLSYLYYSSFTSVLFYSVVFGITAVLFDIAKVQLIDSNRKIDNAVAFLFIIFSVVAAAGVSLNELESAVQTTDNSFYVQQIEKDINLLDNQILIQSKRIENTSYDYATAAQKENIVYNELLEKKQALVEKLNEYNKDISLSQTKITPYITISKLTGLPVRLVMLIYFFVRSILIEIGIVILKEKKEVILEEKFVLAEKPDVNDNLVTGIISRLEQASESEKEVGTKARVSLLRTEITKLLDFKNSKLYKERI